MNWWICDVMKPSGEIDGSGGQLSKHTIHFSVTISRRLGKHAGISMIDALINKVIALFICMSLMCLCSVCISMILNLRLVSLRSSSGGGFPQILFPPSYAIYHHLSCHHLITKIT